MADLKRKLITNALIIVCTIFVGLSSLQAAFADDDTGFYIGAGINKLSADFEDEYDTNFDDSDNAFSVKAGYMFNTWAGIEFGYLDLGDYQGEGDSLSNRLDLDANALSLAFVANWAVLDQMDLYGKVGAYQLDVESRSTIGLNPIRVDEDESELFGAFGVEYDIGQVNLFAEFSIADTDINDLAIDIATAGVKFEFSQ